MSTEPCLIFEPSELIFRFERYKQLSSSIRLTNTTDDHVAFKLLTNNPKKYVVRPIFGILPPGSDSEVRVSTRTGDRVRRKDRFMIQSAFASSAAATIEDVKKMFDKEAGRIFNECKLHVVYSQPESYIGASGVDGASNVPEIPSPVVAPSDNIVQLSPRKLLEVQPTELQVPLRRTKEVTCLLKLSNGTEDHVAFGVNNANLNCDVQPNLGILLPQSTRDITVKMQVETEIPSDTQTEKKLVLRSKVASAAATIEDIQDMFDNTRPPEECELQVVNIQEIDGDHDGGLIQWGFVFLLGFICCYLIKKALSQIWSLIVMVMVLLIKMMKKLVSESLEDWVVTTVLYIIKYIVFGRKEQI